MKLKQFILILFFLPLHLHAQSIYEVSRGTINFHSDAPQELISAGSGQLQGVMDIEKRTFAFKISIASFKGFNNPLQQEHFNENYMETSLFPFASFVGKIIEDADFTKDGIYTVRAKGKMKIHGVEQERIITSTVTCKKGKITIHSDFIVLLADHNIKIPRLVNEKLAPEISVSISANLQQKTN